MEGLPPSPTFAVDSFLQPFYSRTESFDDVPDMPNLVKLCLQLVDLPEYLAEARDLSVRGGHGCTSTYRLVDGACLSLRRKVLNTVLYRAHQPLEVLP